MIRVLKNHWTLLGNNQSLLAKELQRVKFSLQIPVLMAEYPRLEPETLQVDDDVELTQQSMGFLRLLNLYDGHNQNLAIEVAKSWNEGRVHAFGVDLKISEKLIRKVSSLKMECDFVKRENHSQSRNG